MAISSVDELIRSMSPRLNEGVYCFVSISGEADITALDPIASIREDEGTSLIVEESLLDGTGVEIVFRAAWITLTLNSDLSAVGLTAAVAKTLADKGISCNVVAGTRHDHLFVPLKSATEAMAALNELQSTGAVV